MASIVPEIIKEASHAVFGRIAKKRLIDGRFGAASESVASYWFVSRRDVLY
jgi:hypothetical protein